MRIRDLNEATVVNFADRAEATLSGIGSAAKRALGSFKNAAEKADADAKDTAKKAADALTKKKTAGGEVAAAPTTIASIILSRQPDENDLPELEGFDALQFENLQNALVKMLTRMNRFTKTLTRELENADFVNDQDKGDIPIRLKKREKNIIEASDNMLSADKNGEHEAWTLALTDDDGTTGAKSLLDMLYSISQRNGAQNLAGAGSPGTGAGRERATGMNLVNMLGAQQFILEQRLLLLKPIFVRLASKPVTAECLQRLGKLAKRL